jgi:diaminopimelate decarboxylase
VTTVYITGVHSGPNPSPGLGVARSIRQAFDDVRLVALDYSTRSTGLHHRVFDDVLVQRPWPELDLQLHRDLMTQISTDGYLIPGLDLEIAWLAQDWAPPPGYLGPNAEALRWTDKLDMPAAQLLGFRVPDLVALPAPETLLHQFIRRHGGKGWLKGRHYEAKMLRDWQSFRSTREELHDRWPEGLLLQEHVSGTEGAIAFVAWKGQLLGAVRMGKTLVTPEGKTWAGRVEPVTGPTYSALAEACEAMGWSGGAELEYIETENGDRFLIDFNPRFPAWIHGATIGGVNLPARLLAAAAGYATVHERPLGQEFVRVVWEIPVRPGLGPALVRTTPAEDTLSGKHPSGMPQLASRLSEAPGRRVTNHAIGGSIQAERLPAELTGVTSTCVTPVRLRLPEATRGRFDLMARLALDVERRSDVLVRVAYSLKTDPHPMLVAAALEHNFLVEAISQDEVQTALAAGFPSEKIVLNGPVPSWDTAQARRSRVHAWFADSVEALEAQGSLAQSDIVGVRVRLPGVSSRFGVLLDDPVTWSRLMAALRGLRLEKPDAPRFGLQIHTASSTVGTDRWQLLYETLVDTATAIERLVGVPVSCFDLGGGWHPDDGDEVLAPALSSLLSQARSGLAGLDEAILEPGKWLALESAVLLTRVVEIRRTTEACELVVDASTAEMPNLPNAPTRIISQSRDGSWHTLREGNDRIVGRLCMEEDVLARDVDVPEWVLPGDLMGVLDAGAYNASMSYEFGRGSSSPLG